MASADSPLWGLSVKYLAARCGVSEKTAGRWKSGQTVPPKTALWIILGDLGCFHSEWRGWIVNHEGKLVSPEGWCVTVGDVLASPLLRAQLALYRSENVAMKAAIEASLEAQKFPEDQPTPDQWGWDLSDVKVR